MPVRVSVAMLLPLVALLPASLARANPPLHRHSEQPGVLPPAYATLACTNCHVSSGGGLECGSFPCFNPFGYAYWTHQGGWADVATLDSDGDGRTNEQEIYVDLTLPGFPEGATSAGCDMTSCARTGSQTCGAGVHCESAHAWHAAHTHFQFWFSCQAACAGAPSASTRDWSAVCTDADECAAVPCASGTCTDTPLASWTPRGYTCACGSGSGFDGTTCTPSSECTSGTPVCIAGASCTDPTPAPGDALCACPSGTSGDARAGGVGCTDDDECAANPCTNGVCHALPLPTWSAPGYECGCHAGYVWDGASCALVDECVGQANDCVPAALCTDPSHAVGDFECACVAGYTGDGHGTGSGTGCTDVDECARGLADCGLHAMCVNTPGTFSCVCLPGYAGDGHTCADVDECADPTIARTCSPDATCTNLPGSYRCVCDPGFVGDGISCMRPVDAGQDSSAQDSSAHDAGPPDAALVRDADMLDANDAGAAVTRSGCGCRVPPSRSSDATAVWLALAILGVIRARRAGRGRRSCPCGCGTSCSRRSPRASSSCGRGPGSGALP